MQLPSRFYELQFLMFCFYTFWWHQDYTNVYFYVRAISFTCRGYHKVAAFWGSNTLRSSPGRLPSLLTSEVVCGRSAGLSWVCRSASSPWCLHTAVHWDFGLPAKGGRSKEGRNCSLLNSEWEGPTATGLPLLFLCISEAQNERSVIAEHKVIIVGLDNAGKTTILYQL